MNKVGTWYHYWSHDIESNRADGKFHVYETMGRTTTHRGAFKTLKGAHNWCVRQNKGRDTFYEE